MLLFWQMCLVVKLVFGKLPAKYLGLPLCLGLPKKHLWDSVVERIEKKLSSWKGRYLSMGGRVTLIKSILSRIPIYFLSCFHCPKTVSWRIERLHCPKTVSWRIERLQRDFLWNDYIVKKKVSFGTMGECV